jgi:hypothetical protein
MDRARYIRDREQSTRIIAFCENGDHFHRSSYLGFSPADLTLTSVGG